MLATLTKAYDPGLQSCLEVGAEVTLSFKGGATSPLTSYAAALGVGSIVATVREFSLISIPVAGGTVSGYSITVEYSEDDLPGTLTTIENCAVCAITCVDSGCFDPCATSLPNLATWPIVRSVDPVEDGDSIPLADSFGSGLAYWPQNNSLIVVDNTTPRLAEISIAGVFIRYIDLVGFVDVEGITPIDPSIGLFAIIEEDLATICRITIPFTGAATITKGVSYPDVLVTGIAHGANLGLEAVLYDAQNLRYLVATEKEDASVWGVWSVTDEAVPNIEQLFSLYSILAGVATDISDMTLTNLRTLLLASHEGSTVDDEQGRLIEVSLDGRIIQNTNVPFFRKLEGIDLSPTDSRLFLVGEPGSGSSMQYQEWRHP